MTTLVQVVWQCSLGPGGHWNFLSSKCAEPAQLWAVFPPFLWQLLCLAEPLKVDTEVSHHCSGLGNSSLSFSPAQLFASFQSDAEILYLESLPEWVFPPAGGKKNGCHDAGRLLSIPGAVTSSLVMGWRADFPGLHLSLADSLSTSTVIPLPHLWAGEELHKWIPNRLCLQWSIWCSGEPSLFTNSVYTHRTHTKSLQIELTCMHLEDPLVHKWHSAHTVK